MQPNMAQMRLALANNQPPTGNTGGTMNQSYQHVGETGPSSTGYTYRDTRSNENPVTIPWGGNKGLAPWVTAQNINNVNGNSNLSTNPADYPDYKAPPPPVNITFDPKTKTMSGPNGPITNPFNNHPTVVAGSSPPPTLPSFMNVPRGETHIYDQYGNDVSYLIPQSTKGPSPHVSTGYVPKHYADGGLAKTNSIDLKNIGANEAPGMSPKSFFSPDNSGSIKVPPPGGVAMPNGMAIGGVDANPQQPGQQMMPGQQDPNQQGGQQPGQPQQGGAPGAPPASGGPAQPMGNMLSMTPQGQQMDAMGGGQPPQQPPTQMAKGGEVKISKTSPKEWAGTGFGYKGATYGIDTHPHIAIKRESHGWTAIDTQNRSKRWFGTDKNDLENELAKDLLNPTNMAKGGRVKFAIAPAERVAKGPEHFTPYDHENPSMKGLATAFDEALAHHLSLPHEERAHNSIRAAERVADIVGRTSNGTPKDLLGKNEKLLKSERGYDGGKPVELPDGRGIETTGLALAPAYREGKFDTCPNHHSCKAECLGKTSGNYFKLGGGQDLSEFLGPRLNSLVKTHAFLHAPHDFAVKLHDEISDAKAIAAQNGNHLGVRLNVLSDINPRVHKAIIHAHPDVTFYDYTKNNTDPIAPNHHYTYSSTGVSQPGVENQHTNWKSMRRRLEQGDNVAMAFSHKDHLPEEVHDQETGKKFKVINGDTHDFRPLDIQPEGEHGVIVGLKNKKATGKMDEAHLDSHGFFVHYDPMLKVKKNDKGATVYEREKSERISPKTGKAMLGNTIPQNKIVHIGLQKSAMVPISNDDGGKHD